MKGIIAILCFTLASGLSFALDLQSVLNDGWKHYNNSNYKQAAWAFEAAARIDPSSAEALKGMGMSYIQKGRTEYNPGLAGNAATAFRRALEIDPNMPDVRYQLGVACLETDDKPGADIQYQSLVLKNKALADQLAKKIAEYKPPPKPEEYRYLGETIIESSGPRFSGAKCAPGESWNSITNTCNAPSQTRRSGVETTGYSNEPFGFGSKKKSKSNNNHRTVNTPPVPSSNSGAINPFTGEYYAPAGSGYVGTRDGTYYAPAGPNGVIDTSTGKFVPVH